MKNEKKIKSYLLVVAFGVLLYVIALNYRSLLGGMKYIVAISKPFLIGSVIAFIINVPMRALETGLFKRIRRRKVRRIVSLLTTLFLLVLVLWAVLTLVLPELYNTIESIGQRIPGAIETAIEWGDKMAKKYPQIEGYIVEAEKALAEFNWEETITKSLNLVKNGVGGLVNTTIDFVGTMVSAVINFGIGFVFAIYVLLQKEKLASQCKQVCYAIFKEEKADEVVRISRLGDNIFSSFLSGQVVEAIILGTMFFISMSIFKFPYALLVGVLIAITALIPIFGAFIGLAVGAFLILMVDPMQALWFVIMFFILQQIEGNLIYPNVVGSSIGLPGIWVLIAVSVGGSMFGVMGMLVFIPMVSLLYTLTRDYVKKRLEEKGIEKSKWKTVYASRVGTKKKIATNKSENEVGKETISSDVVEEETETGEEELVQNTEKQENQNQEDKNQENQNRKNKTVYKKKK